MQAELAIHERERERGCQAAQSIVYVPAPPAQPLGKESSPHLVEASALRPPKADGKARSGRLDVVPPARGDVERVPGTHSAVPVRHAGEPGPVRVGLAVEVDRAAVGVHALPAARGGSRGVE